MNKAGSEAGWTPGQSGIPRGSGTYMILSAELDAVVLRGLRQSKQHEQSKQHVIKRTLLYTFETLGYLSIVNDDSVKQRDD